MKLLTVAGPPASGKTAVLSKALASLAESGLSVGAVKFDCIATRDPETYQKLGISCQKGLSGSLCPDHYFASSLGEAVSWGKRRQFDLLATESAGLCNRCAPHVRGLLGICVVDCLGGVAQPSKIGPMLKLADIVVLTKGDLVSQAEREVFRFHTKRIAPRALFFTVNGLTGQGTRELGRLLYEKASEVDTVADSRLRFALPAALCSYCLGETRLGENYQVGNVNRLELDR